MLGWSHEEKKNFNKRSVLDKKPAQIWILIRRKEVLRHKVAGKIFIILIRLGWGQVEKRLVHLGLGEDLIK